MDVSATFSRNLPKGSSRSHDTSPFRTIALKKSTQVGNEQRDVRVYQIGGKVGMWERSICQFGVRNAIGYGCVVFRDTRGVVIAEYDNLHVLVGNLLTGKVCG